MRKRRGASLVEAAAALVLMAAASVVLAQLLHAMAGQQRGAEQRLLAQQVAMQQIEQWMNASTASTDIALRLDVKLPAEVREVLPESNCRWEITSLAPPDKYPAGERLTVTVDWQSGPSRLPQQVRLVGFKFRSEEPTP